MSASQLGCKEPTTATLCFTKAGRGVKVVAAGVWYYTSKAQFSAWLNGDADGCVFETIEDELPAQQNPTAMQNAIEVLGGAR